MTEQTSDAINVIVHCKIYLFELMGSYRMDAAAVAALVLLLLSLGLFSVVEYLVVTRHRQGAHHAKH